jgi:hypothetical protein
VTSSTTVASEIDSEDVTLEVGRDACVATNKLPERPLVRPGAHDHKSANIDGFGIQARGHPGLPRGPDGPSYPLGLGTNGYRKPVAEPRTKVYNVRAGAEHVDGDLRFPFVRQPGDTALETVYIEAVALR